MQSVALHELEHAHLLDHVNNSDPMFAFLPKNVVRRTLTPFDIEGGKKMMQINNAIYSGSNCNTSIMQPFVCMVNDHEIDKPCFDIFPSPNPSSSTIHFDLQSVNRGYHLQLHSVQGKLCFSGLLASEIDVSQLPSGIYIGQLIENNKIVSYFKLIKL